MTPRPRLSRAPAGRRGRGRGLPLAVTAALVALLALAGGCARRGARHPQAPVVLVSIDTLRSDHLPAYGYRQVETPAIDALRRDGILYARAYSHVPLTLPSHTTVLTGLLPTHHQVRDNFGYRLDAAAHPTLATALRQAGYATGAAISAFVLRPETGLDAGFDRYDAELPEGADALAAERPGAETVRAALAWLRGVPAGKPFFLFVHLYEPHQPYTPPEPFASRYPDRPYDGEIATADAAVGALVSGLRELGRYDPAAILLLSDHGEGLGDHGERDHGVLLYREALQVPLILKLPGGEGAGTTVSAPVGLADVAPTILDLVAAPPLATSDGRPLPRADGPAGSDAARPLYAETYYPRLHFGWSELGSVIAGSRHLIEGARAELFDLGSDPGERHDLGTVERRDLAELRSTLARLRVPLAPPAAPADAETARQLAALGYLTQGAAPDGAAAADPRDHVAELEGLGEGMRRSREGDFAGALPLLTRVVERNPQMADAWEALGQAHWRLGQLDAARGDFEKALHAAPGSPLLALDLARLLVAMGRGQEAVPLARMILASDPMNAHHVLAEAALQRRDVATAEQELRAAVAARGHNVRPLLALANLLLQTGRAQAALETLGSADAERAGRQALPGERSLRGDALAQLRRVQEAEAAYEEELAAFPDQVETYCHLAALYAVTGRTDEAGATLKKLLATVPTPEAYQAAARTLASLGDPESARAVMNDARRRFGQPGKHP